MRGVFTCAIALCAVLPVHAQETYKWVDEKGVVNYSTTPPAGKASKAKVVEDRISVVPTDPDLERQGEALRKREERRAKQEEAESQRRRQQAAAQPAYTPPPPAPDYPYSDEWWYGGGYGYYPPVHRPVRPTHPIARPPAGRPVQPEVPLAPSRR